MFSLKNNPILLPHQTTLLQSFFASSLGQQFFLTGGTALAAFYLAHRESQDLDLFSLETFDTLQLNTILTELAKNVGATIEAKVLSATYHEFYLSHSQAGWRQRLAVVQEQPKHFGKLVRIEGIVVDSLENIASNKILTIYGRLEPKDYIDLYFIIKKTKFTFDELFELAKQKDTGLSEFLPM